MSPPRRRGAKAKFALYRETLRTTGPVSPGGSSIVKESLRRSLPRHSLHNNTEAPQYAFSRHGGIYRSDVVRQKPNPGAGPPPPAGRPRGPGKRTRREDHALLIVRDEFRAGYSLIGLLASRARLRFTGTARINCGRKNENGISSNGKCVFSLVSHRRGSPHLSAFIRVHRRPSAARVALLHGQVGAGLGGDSTDLQHD